MPRQKGHHFSTTVVQPGTPKREKVTQKYKRDLFSREPLLACASCNGGWMKQFEDEVVDFMKPAIEGNLARSLTLREQNSLSGWVTHITALALFARYQNPTTIKRSTLLHLKKHRVPADNFSIYVAELTGERWRRYYMNHNFFVGSKVPPLDANGFPQSNAQVTTIGIGNFLAQILSGPPSATIESYRIAMEGSGLERIWPRTTSFWTREDRLLKFPLKTKLSDKEADVVADALYHRVAVEIKRRS